MPQRAMQGRWKVQVAAEMPETAHTWQRRMPEKAMQGRWKVQVAAKTPEEAHTWQRRKPARAGGNGTKNTVTPTGATVQIPKAKKASLLAGRRPVSSRRSYFTICPDIWPLQAAALASSVSMCMARAYFSETRTTVSPKMSLRPVSCSTSTDTI